MSSSVEYKKINIFPGRFQPFTTGHLKCCKEIYKKTGLPVIICLIETVKPDIKHPFKTADIIDAYKKMVKAYDYIEDIILIKSANVVQIEERLNEMGYSIKSLVCGSDRIESYTRQVYKYLEDADILEIPRDDEAISATKVRGYISELNRSDFQKWTPKEMHPLFNYFKRCLDNL